MGNNVIKNVLVATSDIISLRTLTKEIEVGKNNSYWSLKVRSSSNYDLYTRTAIPLFSLSITVRDGLTISMEDSGGTAVGEKHISLTLDLTTPAQVIKERIMAIFIELYTAQNTELISLLKSSHHMYAKELVNSLLHFSKLGYSSEEVFGLVISAGSSYAFFDASMEAFKNEPLNHVGYTEQQIKDSVDCFNIYGGFGSFKDAKEFNANNFSYSVAYIKEASSYLVHRSRAFVHPLSLHEPHISEVGVFYNECLEELTYLKGRQESKCKLPSFVIPEFLGNFLSGMYLDIQFMTTQRITNRTNFRLLIAPEKAQGYENVYFEVVLAIDRKENGNYNMLCSLLDFHGSILTQHAIEIPNKLSVTNGVRREYEKLTNSLMDVLNRALMDNGKPTITDYTDADYSMKRTGMLYKVMETIANNNVGVHFETYCRTIDGVDTILVYAKAIDYIDKAVGAKQVTFWINMNKKGKYEVLYAGQDIRGLDRKVMEQQCEKVTLSTQFEVCELLNKPFTYWNDKLF